MRGFTLFETLLYIALLSLIIGGFLATSYQIIESSGALGDDINSEEEANFILKKISWALSDVDEIIAPLEGVTANSLTIKRNGEQIAFKLNSGDIFISRDGGADVKLNNDEISINAFEASHIAAGINSPPSVSIRIVIDGEEFEFLKTLKVNP